MQFKRMSSLKKKKKESHPFISSQSTVAVTSSFAPLWTGQDRLEKRSLPLAGVCDGRRPPPGSGRQAGRPGQPPRRAVSPQWPERIQCLHNHGNTAKTQWPSLHLSRWLSDRQDLSIIYVAVEISRTVRKGKERLGSFLPHCCPNMQSASRKLDVKLILLFVIARHHASIDKETLIMNVFKLENNSWPSTVYRRASTSDQGHNSISHCVVFF